MPDGRPGWEGNTQSNSRATSTHVQAPDEHARQRMHRHKRPAQEALQVHSVVLHLPFQQAMHTSSDTHQKSKVYPVAHQGDL